MVLVQHDQQIQHVTRGVTVAPFGVFGAGKLIPRASRSHRDTSRPPKRANKFFFDHWAPWALGLNPPQQGDSNFGCLWVGWGEHQWGQSWRDRPPPPDAADARRPQGVLAGPGTPRDPKINLFATKWIAVAPFGTWGPGLGAEFQRESREGGPAPSI